MSRRASSQPKRSNPELLKSYGQEKSLIDRAIGDLEAVLEKRLRSELVNPDRVLEMTPWTSGTWRITLTGGVELNVSRYRVRRLKLLAGLVEAG